jgi:4-amino-4-deoxy-L-arabinose transferase-like glycosyltransferase
LQTKIKVVPKVPFWVFILISIVYFAAIRIDTMDVDASQYAEISREMLKSGDYLHVYDRGLEYLDKPPFLFWVSAASMKVFGVNNFGFKFPSLLFALWALFATYKLAKLLHGESVGCMAALTLAVCQGMFLMTNDIRCDTILMSWVITAVWLIKEWLVQRKLQYLLAGFAAIAFGMMTKGPIALMVPVFCFGADWALKREWKNFFRAEYLLGFLVIAILLLPMSIGLYQQFDMHPEKLVNGRQGVSGLRFFFWTQSFGRITGENPWKNDVNLFFLLQNMLWSFLPWIVLLIAALIANSAQLVRQKFRLSPQQEWLTTGGFIITYLALGSSAYQLPHYIFVAYPLASIVTAKFMHELIAEKKYKGLYSFFKPFHTVIVVLLLLVVLVLITYVFPSNLFVIISWAACIIVWLYLAFNRSLEGKLFWLPAAGMIIANIFLSGYVYPTLLQYQGGSQAGRYIHQHAIAANDIVVYKPEDPLNAIDFYARERVSSVDTLPQLLDKKYAFTMDKGLHILSENSVPFTVEKRGVLFKVSELTPGFLNPKTRSKEVRNYYIVKLGR